MRVFRLLSAVALALWTLALAPLAAGAAGDFRPLLEMEDRHILAEGPADVAFVDEDLLVARDGTVSLHSVNRGLTPGEPFATTIADGQASPMQLAALNAALAAARPSRFSGVCEAGLFPLGSSYRFTLSWYGVTSRQSQLTVTNDGTATQGCPAGVVELLQAATALEVSVLGDPRTTLKSPDCTDSLQCPAGLLCCYPCGIPGCQNRCMPPASNGHCPLFP